MGACSLGCAPVLCSCLLKKASGVLPLASVACSWVLGACGSSFSRPVEQPMPAVAESTLAACLLLVGGLHVSRLFLDGLRGAHAMLRIRMLARYARSLQLFAEASSGVPRC